MSHSNLFGYQGKILEVNLSSGHIRSLRLQSDMVRDYLGGRGLATRIFFDAVDPASNPLSPENILVIATSPLLGTRAPTACRGHMVFKSPLTGLIGSSNCGGKWAPAFKFSGYDVLVIKGKAAEPCLVDISPLGVEILPAKNIWGLDVHQTTEALSTEIEQDRQSHILCIGPAGENLVRIASAMNDKNRAYGRSGSGAVFGSKNLKAIRVRGRMKIQIKDEERFQSAEAQAIYLMKQAPITKRLLRELGTSGLLRLIHIIEMLPHQNFKDNFHKESDLEKIRGETLRRTILERAGACYGCSIACQRHTRLENKSGEGPEYETIVMTGPDCGIYSLKSITRTNYRLNELGLDTISFGGTLACAMELFEKGVITLKDTGGIALRFGNARALEKMAELVAFRQGIGDKLAEGSFRLASSFEHPEFSMSVKSLEIPAYDPRASFAQALGYMTSPTGACHLRGGYAVSLAFFAGTREIPRFSLLQSPIAIRNMQNLGIIQDSLGICRFTGYAFSTEPWARMVSSATGLDFSVAKIEEIANRIATLERLFNLEAGLESEEDRLPERFSQEAVFIQGKERLISKEAMEKMRSDYYQVRGWDKEGRPTANLLKSLKIKGKRR